MIWRELLHAWCLMCLLASVAVMTLMLTMIVVNQACVLYAFESHPVVLGIELSVVMPSSVMYLVYLWVKRFGGEK